MKETIKDLKNRLAAIKKVVDEFERDCQIIEDKKLSGSPAPFIIDIQSIWWEIKKAQRNNKERLAPDNVMLHSSIKVRLSAEARNIGQWSVIFGCEPRVFGVKVIWTEEIKECEIVCTYNAK